MSTDVPFFEILFMKYCTPSKVERETRLDEIYFKNYPDKRLSTDDFEGLDGLEVCEEKSIGIIREGKRGKRLSLICMKLIYNNPFCHPALIARELQSINYNNCEDPNPKNPAPDEEEINAIVSTCYQKFINGELDFTEVMRKKKNYKDISKRKVFCSKFHVKMKSDEKKKICHKTYTDGNRKKNIMNYEKAVVALQDGTKITQKRIANYMGMSTRNLRRYTRDGNEELFKKCEEIINNYHKTLNSSIQKKS
jgi:DNA-binding transcriptional regulator YiaG